VESRGLQFNLELSGRFKNVNCLEHYGTFFKYKIDKMDFSIGFLFGMMEDLVILLTYSLERQI
jgi:hypothetical protein